MAYNVATLANYAPQNPTVFVGQALFEDKFLALVQEKGNVLTGIKTREKIALMNGDVVLQSGANCSWTPNGDFNVTDKEIIVADIKVEEEYCAKDLQSKYVQFMMQAGSDNFDELAFSEFLLNEKMRKISSAVSNLIWQGDTASGNANLNLLDGLNKQFVTTAGNCINGNPTNITNATGITSANVIAIVDGIVALIPTDLIGKEDVIVAMGYDTYRTYCLALKNANMFNYIPTPDVGMYVPGTNVMIVPVGGLNGTKRIHALALSNLVFGTDLENEHEDVSTEYDSSSKKSRVSAYFKVGITVAYNNEVVTFKLV